MRILSLIAVFKSLVLRGLGSGVAVVFALLVSRNLATAEAASFFVLFNTGVIAAVCFRWGMDEVVIRRIAAADVGDREAIAVSLIIHAHRRVFAWVCAALTLGLLLCIPRVASHAGLNFLDFGVMVAASGLIACAACSARVLQGEGKVDSAIFYLNICAPALCLVALLLLGFTSAGISARQLILCYLLAGIVTYVLAVPLRHVRGLFKAFSSKTKLGRDRADAVAANRLGAVVLAQQALGWSAVAIVPSFYGDTSYAAFVVSQKLATIISLLMLAINFTFSSKFALLHAQGRGEELWTLVRVSIGAILVASLSILVAAWLFMSQILDYARVPEVYGRVVMIMMVGQVAFSIAAVFALVLSMSRMESFLLRAQLVIGIASIAVLMVVCSAARLEVAALVFPASYFVLAFVLGAKVRSSVPMRNTAAKDAKT